MKKVSVVVLCIIALMAVAIWAPKVGAFETYTAASGAFNTNCGQCHGDFRATPYTSLHDGQSWGSSLHDKHRNTMLSGDCNTCHSASGRNPVFLNSSVEGTGLAPISCVGCHGRTEDRPDPTVAKGDGAGLRQHHYKAGETICLQCHNDASPTNYKPVGENIQPPFYFTPDTAHPAKPTSSCNVSGKENFAGSAQGLDNDGDGLYDGNDPDCQVVACIDNDGDGYGANGDPSCTKGTAIDCNDNDPAVNPGATEGPFGSPTCSDGKDNNCDGLADAADPNCTAPACIDNDGDGYSSNGSPSCPKGTAIDCDDNDPKQYPGQTWYQDADGDGYSSGNIIVQCARPTGYKIASELTATSGDCNDNNAAINPGATEICDGVDNNCNGQIDEGIASTPTTCGVGGCASTGTLSCVGGKMVDSCKPGTPTAEICDGKDNDCNGQVDDGIASTPTICGVGVCASTGQLVCQNGKTVDTCTPGTPQTEGPVGDVTCSDALDNDCNGLTDAADTKCSSTVPLCIDNDDDGYGSNGSSLCPKGTAIDCNDNNAAINPGAVEVCDGKDNNCNGQIDEGVKKTFYRDADRDGYGNPSVLTQTCTRPRGYVRNNTDCNDSNRRIHPGAVEICGDKIDNNCNGSIDETCKVNDDDDEFDD